MPRIDPLQLLKCLSVLLSQEGGILSRDEVPRLVNLMTKFSKKLVSKCVYVLILKNTETSLVDMFMAEGGWTLIQTWLQDAAQSGNWDLVKEILGLLLITPVDVERLKMNCLPKLIKNLSRREDLDGVAQLSNQIVQNWLVIVKGSAHGTSAAPPVQAQLEKRKLDSDPISVAFKDIEEGKAQTTDESVPVFELQDEVKAENHSTDNDQAINAHTFYKTATKENKSAGKKSSSDEDKPTADINDVEEEPKNGESKDANLNEKDNKLNEKDKDKSTKSSSSSRSKSSSSSSRDKDRKRSGHSSSSKSKSSSSSRDKDKDRKDKDKDRDKKDKDRHKHSSSSKSSSSKSSSKDKDKRESKDKSKSIDFKDTKEKQAEKDKDTLQKLKPLTLDKLGRIPKKSNSAVSDEKQKETKTEIKSKENSEKDITKKPSFSILNRKVSGEERTKTVKIFNSKMRSTGLEEEVKPPPPRSAKKPTPSVQLPTIPPKRLSPPREPSSMPPEKKLKIDKIEMPERPGAIKLIPPKPKPVLQESDMFMDALTAAAPKKEAKKRKRRPSVTKDTPLSPSSSPAGGDPHTPTSPTPASPTTTALGLKNIAPINFYQDTLSEEPGNSDEIKNDDDIEENKEIIENNINSPQINDTPASPIASNDAQPLVENEVEASPPKIMKTDGLKGILLYAKKKGPKRSIKWKTEEELVDTRYFELDETERVNVTKTFMDMAKMDITSEREALIMSRKTPNEDLMEPQMMWRALHICEQPEHLAAPGSKSLEKDIQFAREKSVLSAMYYDKRRIPDSPEEPVPETHQMSDPVIIPLEDPESQEIDLRSTPWPEPKGSPPQIEPQPMPPMFPTIPFNPSFNNMSNMPPGAPFVGIPPRFPGPAGPLGPMIPGPGVYGPNMIHNNMMGPPMNQPEIMNQGPINPMMYGPGPGNGPDGYMGPCNEQNFPVPQFNGPHVQGPNMNMYGHHRGISDGEGRGGYRRGGNNNGNWVRMNGPRNNWKRGRGGGSRGGRMCKNIINHGYCRNGDNCPFLH